MRAGLHERQIKTVKKNDRERRGRDKEKKREREREETQEKRDREKREKRDRGRREREHAQTARKKKKHSRRHIVVTYRHIPKNERGFHSFCKFARLFCNLCVLGVFRCGIQV